MPKYTVVRFFFNNGQIIESIYTTKYWKKNWEISKKLWEKKLNNQVWWVEDSYTAKDYKEAKRILDGLSFLDSRHTN